MQSWLTEKGVYFPPKALKAQLWDIIKEKLKTEPEYSIDALVKELRPDITIIRLPPYHWSVSRFGTSCSYFKRNFTFKTIIKFLLFQKKSHPLHLEGS